MRTLLLAASLFLLPPLPAVAQTVADEVAETANLDAYGLWRHATRIRDLGGNDNAERALDLFRQAAERYAGEAGADGELMPYYWAEVAATATSLGRIEDARAARLAQIEGLRRLGDDQGQLADAHTRLGWLELAREDNAAAIDAFRKARMHYEGDPTPSGPLRLRLAGLHLDEGVAHFRLGERAAALASYREALAGYRALAGHEDAATVETAAENRGIALANMLTLIDQLDDPSEARAWRVERIELLRAAAPGTERLASALLDLAAQESAAGDHRARLALLDEALAVRRAAGSRPAEIGSIHWERGLAHYFLGEPDAAIAAYGEAVVALESEAAPNHADIASLQGNIAGIHAERGDAPARSEAMAAQAASLRMAVADRSRSGRDRDDAARKLADALDGLARDVERERRHEEALALRREEVELRAGFDPDGISHAIALDNLAFNLQALGRFEESLAILDKALPLALAADPVTRQAAIASAIRVGIARNALGQYDEAMAALEESLEWLDAVEQPDKHNLAVALDNFAHLARLLGRFGQAERIAERQIAVLREHQPGSAFLATSLLNMAESRMRLSRYREALPLIEEARAIRAALSGDVSAEVAETWNMEGQAWEGAKEYHRSLDAYDEALWRVRATVGEETIDFAGALNNAAWARRQVNELERSEREFQQSTAIIERLLGPAHRYTAIGYTNLGILAQLRGRNEDAIRLSMRALSGMMRDPRATLDEQRWTYETLSNAFRELGDTRRAILFAKQAVNAQQQLRANNKELSAEQIQDFKDEWRRLYENLASLLIAEGRLSEAQAVLAMEKEEEFVDFIRRDASADLTETRATLTSREEELQDSIEALLKRPMSAALAVAELKERQARGPLGAEEEARLASLEEALDRSFESFMDDVDAFLERTAEQDADIKLEVDRINLAYTQDIQYELATFDGRAALLSVASLGDTTHLFLTVPETAIHREVPIERVELSRLIFEALNAVESRSPQAAERLKALYDVFIAPVRAEIDETGADTLMLNLQGFLRYVPFAALYDGERYLIEDYALALFTPAARTTFEAAPREPERSAGFGVTAAHPGFSPLPGVAREIDAIFDGGTLSGTASLDAEFTRDSFANALRASPAIVHIASHFKLVPGRETDSFLLLGDGSPLNLAEIRKGRAFRFGGVDLLTLSACQTGRGGDSDGGEVESFGALAQRNGASAVMATLWPVADDATAQLMRSFYQHYVHDEMDKAAALRLAQISMLRGPGGAVEAAADAERGARKVALASEVTAPADRVHPYFWSPFILMGNWL